MSMGMLVIIAVASFLLGALFASLRVTMWSFVETARANLMGEFPKRFYVFSALAALCWAVTVVSVVWFLVLLVGGI